MWEFSGYEPYYITYDYFIGDPSSVNIITFDASQPDDVQRKQVQFWLEFIQCRVPPLGPICKLHIYTDLDSIKLPITGSFQAGLVKLLHLRKMIIAILGKSGFSTAPSDEG